jgi:hypothetical protein
VLKDSIELIRDGEPQALLTWHKPDGEGGTIPIAMEFADSMDPEAKQRVIDVCERPLNVREGGKRTKVFSGSSKHFEALPKVLSRLGFRTRVF